MRRYWFHCSDADRGASFQVSRQKLKCRSEKEPLTPRLCVCPTVAACFTARLFSARKPVYVYKTESRRSGIRPVGVWDECVTGERWLIPPTTMVLERVVDAELAGMAQLATRLYHQSTRKGSRLRLRVAQYAVAVEVLGGTMYDRRMVAKMLDVFGLSGDMESYILEGVDARDS